MYVCRNLLTLHFNTDNQFLIVFKPFENSSGLEKNWIFNMEYG